MTWIYLRLPIVSTSLLNLFHFGNRYIYGHYSMTISNTETLIAFYKILVLRDIAIPTDLIAKLLEAGVDVSALARS